MTNLARIIFSVALVMVAGYCLFGFLATLEPGPRDMAAWRAAYSVIGVASIGGAIWLLWLAAARPRMKK